MPTPENGQHTRTIRQLLLMNCLSVFDHFVELALKGLTFSCIMLKNGQTCSENLAVNYLFITALNFSQITACKSRYKSVFFPIFLLSFMYYTKTLGGQCQTRLLIELNRVGFCVTSFMVIKNLFEEKLGLNIYHTTTLWCSKWRKRRWRSYPVSWKKSGPSLFVCFFFFVIWGLRMKLAMWENSFS